MEHPVTGLTATGPPAAGRLALATLVLVAVVPFRALLADGGFLVVAALAVATVTGISWALSPRRPVAVSVLAATTAMIAGAALLLGATGVPVRALADELARLPAAARTTLLTEVLPAPATPHALVLPVGAAAVAAFLAAELAARSRWLLLGTVPPGALLVVSLLFLGRQGPPPVAVVGAFVAGVLVVAALEHGPFRRRPAGIAVALAVGLATAAVATVVPGGQRTDLHDGRGPGTAALASGDPLAQAGAARAAPDDPVVFRVEIGGPRPAGDPGPPLRLRVATLDAYDGAAWKVGRTFTPVGDLLPRRYDLPGDGPVTTQTVTLTGAFTGPFVPAPASPAELGEAGRERLRYDRDVGDIVLTAGAVDGLRYQVTAPVAPSTVPALDDEEVRRLTALPDPVPEQFRSHLRTVRDGPPRARADALARLVQDGPWGFDDQATPGHSYHRLDDLLGSVAVSTIEQPAATLAVLARVAGIPSRVVVGYEVPEPVNGSGAPVEVTARQVWVWTELHVPGEGWAAYDVTPRAPRPVARARVVASTSTTSTTVFDAGRSPAAATTLAPAPRSDADDCPPPGPCEGDEAAGVPPPWPLLAIGALAAVPFAIVAAKRVRRRLRRTRRSPEARLSGAWRESMADLRSHRLELPAGMTAAELARQHDPPLAPDVSASLTRLARVVDTAVFAAPEPDHDLADEAWASHAGLATALRTASSRRRRLLVALDPRSLVSRP